MLEDGQVFTAGVASTQEASWPPDVSGRECCHLQGDWSDKT